jgi:hypothetical protein
MLRVSRENANLRLELTGEVSVPGTPTFPREREEGGKEGRKERELY